MYRSKSEIEKRIAQTRYEFKQLAKFEGRIFVHGGRDEETGYYPLITRLSSFAALGRSVFQYALEEVGKSPKRKEYDDFVKTVPLSNFLRN